MSLSDKQKSLQFGREYGSDAQRWHSMSSGYAPVSDTDRAAGVQEKIDQNVLQAEERNEESVIPDPNEKDIPVHVTQTEGIVSDTQPAAESQDTQASLRPAMNEPHSTPEIQIFDTQPSGRQKHSFTAPQKKAGPIRLDANKHTILIVDDDFDTRSMYAAIFNDAGFNVIEASDGLEGLDLATKHQPDVIFTGIIMPRMDGFTMVEALKKNTTLSDVPIVINSHLGRTQDKERAKTLGVREFIVRDYTAPREVVDRISALLVTMEYIVPFDPNAPYATELLADIGGMEKLDCTDDLVLVLRLSNAQERTFSAKLTCKKQKK